MELPPSLTQSQVSAIERWIKNKGVSTFGHAKARRVEVIIKLGLLAGLRSCEMCGILWSDITINEMEGGQIHVRASVAKGGDPRVVPLSEELRNALGAWSTYHPRSDVRISDLPVLWNTSTLQALTTRQIRRICRKVGEIAILRPTNPHLFRHTFASRLLAAGTDLRVIQQLLGHKHLASTEKYLHPDEAARRGAIQNMPKMGEAP